MTSPPSERTPAPAVIDGIDVDAVAAAVRACPGVSALDGGWFGEASTYLPGRTVAGVVVDDGRVMVQVRSRWGIPAAELAALITTAASPFAGHRRIDVVIADIDDPPGAPGSAPAGGLSGTGLSGTGAPLPDPGLPPV